jgi:PAS domain S-box-containing protein
MSVSATTAKQQFLSTPMRRWQYLFAVSVLLVGIAFSAGLYIEFRNRDYARAQHDFQRASRDRIFDIRRTLEFDILELTAARAFYVGSQRVERDEFTAFVTPLIKGHPNIVSLQWVPRISESERPRFEDAANRDVHPLFQITQYDAGGRLIPAPRREEWFPVLCSEPDRGNPAVLGFDLGADNACREAMDRARDTGMLVSTTSMSLCPEAPERFGVRLFAPIYRKNVSLNSVQDRREHLDGFVVEVLRLDDVIAESLPDTTPVGLDLRIVDSTNPHDEKLLCSYHSRMPASDGESNAAETTGPQDRLLAVTMLDLPSQRWTIFCTTSPQFIAARMTWQPLGVAFVVLVVTGAIVAYLFRTAKLTNELGRTNRRLANEIIDRNRAEEASQREYAKLSAMISAMRDGVVFADADNVIVEVNQSLCDMMGRSREDVLGNQIEDIHQPEMRARIIQRIGRFRAEIGSGPFVLQRPLGSAEVILQMQPIYRDGKYDGVLLNVVDVSELVKARREAEIANMAKSTFLANMSHEIRTPVAAILGYADLLMDPTTSSENRNYHAAIIRQNGEHLLALINDILDLSKIEGGRLSIERRRCNIMALLSDVASAVWPRAQRRGISLSVEHVGEIPETILTDATRLRQAIVSLAANAVKFTPHGGARIVASFLPAWRNDEPAVQIEVIDTGVGIHEEVLPRLFGPFDQADLTQEAGGVRFGLTIARSIVAMLGGELTATSVLGQGSDFTIVVPTGDLQSVAMVGRPSESAREDFAGDREPPTEDLKGIRILLAEDSLDNRELIQTVLRIAGAEVETAENGREAVEKAEAAAFDLILMDVNMPEMNGFTATRLLRDHGYVQPILALTANAMVEENDECLQAGCNEHLSKPITRARLIRTVARYVGRATVHDARELRPAPTAIETPPSREDEILVSEFVDDPDMAEILGGFVDRLGGQLDAMRHTHENGQCEELQRLAHKLKGAGGCYGYPTLTEACGALEAAAKAGDRDAASAALDKATSLGRAIQNGYNARTSAGSKP